MAIHEVVPIYPDMKELIMRNATSKELFDLARTKGAKSIKEDGIQKVMAGETTISEILRVSYGGGDEE